MVISYRCYLISAITCYFISMKPISQSDWSKPKERRPLDDLGALISHSISRQPKADGKSTFGFAVVVARANMADAVQEVISQVSENLTENASNATTGRVPSTPEGMAIAYGSIVIMAVLPIFFGSYRSVKHHREQQVSIITTYLYHAFVECPTAACFYFFNYFCFFYQYTCFYY